MHSPAIRDSAMKTGVGSADKNYSRAGQQLRAPLIESRGSKGISASPLDQLIAMGGTINQTVSTNQPSSALPPHLRPIKQSLAPATSAPPLIFNNFRHSRASSLGSTRDSVYTDLDGMDGEEDENDEELRAWFEGRHRVVVPSKGDVVEVDQGWGSRKHEAVQEDEEDDETGTESESTAGETPDEHDEDDEDGRTALDHTPSTIPLNLEPSRSPEAFRRPQRNSSALSFTTSSRLSHFLDISASESLEEARDEIEALILEQDRGRTDSLLPAGTEALSLLTPRSSPISTGNAPHHPCTPSVVPPTSTTVSVPAPASIITSPSTQAPAAPFSNQPAQLTRDASVQQLGKSPLNDTPDARVAVESLYRDEGLSWDWSTAEVVAAVTADAPKAGGPIRAPQVEVVKTVGTKVIGIRNFSRPVKPVHLEQRPSPSPTPIPLAPPFPPPVPTAMKPFTNTKLRPTVSISPLDQVDAAHHQLSQPISLNPLQQNARSSSSQPDRPLNPLAQLSYPPSALAAPPIPSSSSHPSPALLSLGVKTTYAYSATPAPGQIFKPDLHFSQDPNTIFTAPRPAFAGGATSSSKLNRSPHASRSNFTFLASPSNLAPPPGSLPTRRAPAPPFHQSVNDSSLLSSSLRNLRPAQPQSHLYPRPPPSTATSSYSSPISSPLIASPDSTSRHAILPDTAAHRTRTQTSPEVQHLQSSSQRVIPAPCSAAPIGRVAFPTPSSSMLVPTPMEGRQRSHSSAGTSSISSNAAVRNLPFVSPPVPLPPFLPAQTTNRSAIDTENLSSSSLSRSAANSPSHHISPASFHPSHTYQPIMSLSASVPTVVLGEQARPMVGRSASHDSGIYSFYELSEPSARSSSTPSGSETISDPSSYLRTASSASIRGTYHKVDLNASSPLAQLAHIPSPDSHSTSRSPSSSLSSMDTDSISPFNPSTPSHHLALGISAHGSGRLEQASHHFELAATLSSGCPGGMLFWGLSLRSGWGTERNESEGFKWLSRACEEAASGMDQGDAGSGMGGGGAAAIRPEVVVAIFETAQCFLRGWGVAKNPVKAQSYLLIAARLSDLDAQLALASCYLHGIGTPNRKKNKPAAAYWYRRAIEQGASSSGLGWVNKKKYASYKP